MSDNNNLLSCIIITYNQGKYIYEAIDSVLSQKYPEFELIIADDGSADFNKSKIEEHIEQRKTASLLRYIVYSNKKNVGTVKNINGAIKKTSGKYIKIFGGDDVIAHDDVFHLQVDYLINHPGEYIVTGKSIQCDEAMNQISDKSVDANNLLIPKVISAESAKEKYKIISQNYIFPFMTQSMCFRLEYFDTYGLYDERYQLLEDTPMMNRIIDQNIRVGFLDIYTIKHRTKVGISSADILYNPRSLRYYEDCKLIAQEKLDKACNIVDKITAWQQWRIASLRVDLCNKNSGFEKSLCYLAYLPNIVCYSIQSPKKLLRKIFHRFRS